MRNLVLTAIMSSLVAAHGVCQIKMVEIPAGSFYMGSDGKGAQPDEVPVHKVTISRPFRMSATEITNAEYEKFRPEHRLLRGKDNVSREDDEAVVNVSWQDAMDYCEWLSRTTGRSYRLPTEAEWEYACRAGTYTIYNTGDGLPGEMMRNQTIARDYKPVSLSVGKTTPNAFGLYDMHGNVEEWCLDWYGPYSAESSTDPAGPRTGEYRVTRGGSHHTPAKYLRTANRMAMIPDDRHSLTGFRIVESDFTPHPFIPDASKPLFMEPQVYIVPPVEPGTPLYSHNHQPSVTWCDNGDLLAIWFSAEEENSREIVVLSSRLPAGSDTWKPAELFFKVPDRNVTGSAIMNDGKGHILHMNGVEAAGDWQNLALVMRRSDDNGHSWSSPRIVEPEHSRRHQVISGTSVLSDGSIIQACDAGPGGSDGTSLHISRDSGMTWQDQWDGAPLPEFCEGGKGTTLAGIHAGVVELTDGRLMALGRSNSIADKQGRKRMPVSISADQGKTWTYHASEFPPIDGGQRLVLMRLNEGPLLLVSFTDHPQRTPENERGMDFADGKGYGMYAALSYDDGRTWPVKKLLTDGRERLLNGGAWTGEFIMDGHHAEPRGYLAGTQSPDGIIHILSSRLHYRFTLPWLESSAE